MDTADPLCAISSPALLLPRTLGPAPAPAPVAGPPPSKDSDALLQAFAVARSLLGSEELVKQAKMVLKEHGDIKSLYHDGVKAGPADQQGRRPALNRKRARFTMKDTAASKAVPVVDRSKLTNISDPVEYFMALDRLEEAEEEIKRLNGEAEKRVLNFDPVDEPKRQTGFRGRKSLRSFKIFEDGDIQGPIEAPASQTASQDVIHTVADKNNQSVPSSSGEAISNVSGKEDSLAEKDGCDDLTYLLTSMQNLDESEEEEFIRKALGLKELRKERVSLRNSIPGVRPPKSSMRVHPPESPLHQARQVQVSELEKHVFDGGAANAKCTDDESEGLPDIVMGEPSLVHDLPMTNENFAGSEIDRATPNLGARAADHILDPERSLPDGGSSVGLCRDTEVAKENEAHEVVKECGVLQDKLSQLLEMPLEDIDPVNQPQMHGGSTKKKQQAAQESKVKERSKRDKKVADEASHAPEIPQANFDSENQPHNDDVNIEQQTVMSSTQSPNGAKGQKGAQRRNKTKKLNQRKILGDADLRRSSRTRSRPLEFWRGERLLYGPIIDELPAVIGIKAYSPGQDGKKQLKVKSFVPEQYSQLVATSAKY